MLGAKMFLKMKTELCSKTSVKEKKRQKEIDK